MLQALDAPPRRACESTSASSASPSASLLLLLSPEHTPAAASGAPLPKLSIPRAESGVVTGPHQWSAFQTTSAATQPRRWDPPRVDGPEQGSTDAKRLPETPVGPETRSPSSPSSFFQTEAPKFGLSELLEAAEQVRPERAGETRRPAVTTSSPLKRGFSASQAPPPPPPLPSLMHSMGGYPLEAPAAASGPKRVRLGSDVGSDMQASYQLLGSLPRQAMVFPNLPRLPQAPAPQELERHVQQQQLVWNPPVSREAASSVTAMRRCASAPSGGRGDGPSVWDAVLSTGQFPPDVCLSEHSSSSGAGAGSGSSAASPRSPLAEASDPAAREVKQGRWSPDEEQQAQALIQAVHSGQVALPPNVSMRQFVAESLQCKAMRVSKKFHGLGQQQQQQQQPERAAATAFNPLSLRSIMNSSEETAQASAAEVSAVTDSMAHTQLGRASPTGAGRKAGQRVLKRSDYSQHGVVRSGRWSAEEEQYAKAMIEAFKAGYLPLHGNVSLRKFLSEVLVCHPMRISKKFVGYVRKYHWYRIAAGKCDPEAKRQALRRLSHLERLFWSSLHQTNDWAASQRRDD